ncbi:YeiH family protein [Sneathiella sp.]|uniref:YeiH family protein n=1 Tax=Sneathiella sp. TaxID=1964365 RepID=UPI0035666C04
MTKRNTSPQSPIGADLYGEIFLAETIGEETPRRRIASFFPGLVVVAIAAAAATYLSEHYGMPVILAGLLIGLSLNFISSDDRVNPGLDLCSTNFLRWGIVLLGSQITVMQITDLGLLPFLALITIMALVIFSGLFAANMFGQNKYVGLLAGGATAICGASAALAIYAIIGRDRLEHHRFTFTLVGISLASALAMSIYPILAQQFHFTDRQAGFLMGAAIHDVAQSLGGGFSYSHGAGEVTTIVKLTRVTLLAPVVALIGLAVGQESGAKKGLLAHFKLPWFIVAFFAVVAVNSLIDVPALAKEYGLFASKGLLLLAVIATAMRSRLDALMSEGWRGLIPVFTATLVSFLASFFFAWRFI